LEPLPIDPRLPDITGALALHGSAVVEAPPGAGKSTRVPPALLPLLPTGRQVVVLEPRRIAARTAAVRVAHELHQDPGALVGYQVRFESLCGPDTRIRFVTEGVLVRQLADDPLLHDVGVLVLDEFHERHVHTDLILAAASRLRRTHRPDLMLAVMSATLDPGPLATFLGGCPIVRVEGRRFPVQIEHADKPDERPIATQVASALRRLVAEGLDGSVLVFLPGAREIRFAMDACAPVAAAANLDLVRLHGDMPAADQDRALAPSARHKVILATNVAETSLTIEGVVAVIDSGLARVAGHAPWSGLPTLRVQPISKASAAQRTGRAGRTRPGRCLRLYTRHDYDRRPDHDTPEILRADLAEAVLTLAAIGVDDPFAFPWYERPPDNSLAAARQILRLLGAVTDRGELTPTGRAMLRFPLHPRTARLLVEAERRGVARQGCVIAALLGERDLDLSRRALPHAGSHDTDRLGDSDVTSSAALLEQARRARFDAATLRETGIDIGAARAVDRAARQLERLVRSQMRSLDPAQVDRALRIALLSAYPDRVARRVHHQDLMLAQGGSASLSPASEVKHAELLVAIDAEERRDARGRHAFVRIASAIEPDWLLELLPEHVRDSADLRWNQELERVDVVERLSWMNLVLDESTAQARPGPEVGRLLAERALQFGLSRFAPEGAVDRIIARVALLRDIMPEIGLPRIDGDDARMALEQMCESASCFAELRAAGLHHALLGKLTARQRVNLDAHAPERVVLPSGRSLTVHYEIGKPPWVESRLQDFFGMKQGPHIAAGRCPLVLHLLAPNQRAVQVTRDLEGFWERTYATVRKELCRKYPKHDWPLDGRTATPPPPGRLRAART